MILAKTLSDSSCKFYHIKIIFTNETILIIIINLCLDIYICSKMVYDLSIFVTIEE